MTCDLTVTASAQNSLLWPPYVIEGIIFLPCNFFLSFFLFFLAYLSGRRLDVYHTLTHGVALLRI